jgi:hypothetical protein
VSFGREDGPRGVVHHPVRTGVAELVPDPDMAGAWTLYLNGVAQSHVDTDDPELIAFDYIRRMVDVIDCLAPGGPVEVLHLGAGAMTLPRCLARQRPGSLQTVVEVDDLLLGLVLRHMPLPEGELIGTVIGDAADELAAVARRSQDVIVADIFQGADVPAHVSTVDFVKLAASALRPDGCYLANIMDQPSLRFAREQARMLRQAFGEVAVIADAAVLRGRRSGNLLLVGASPQGLSPGPAPAEKSAGFQRLVRRMAGDPFATRVEYGDRLDRFVAG